MRTAGSLVLLSLLTLGCDGTVIPVFGPIGVVEAGAQGPAGPAGKPGAQGPAGPAGKGVATSGERIKARWHVGADGARLFAGFTDSELDVECSLRVAGDGVRRCLPVTGLYVRYADDKCSQAIVTAPCGGGYAEEPLQPNACGGLWNVLRPVGEPTEHDGPVYQRIPTSGNCVPSGDTAGPFFALGPVIDPGTFVAFETEEDP